MTDTVQTLSPDLVGLLRCPRSGARLKLERGSLIAEGSGPNYPINASGIPLIDEHPASADAARQQEHYERIAAAYRANLDYPHTQEYMDYLDRALMEVVETRSLATVAEICCGNGEAFELVKPRIERGVGVDISVSMLESAVRRHPEPGLCFVQGNATRLPLADAQFSSVFMLGGIHHVSDRRGLFEEIFRVLRPGGRFYFREPVSDFFLWRWIRAIVYRVSPVLDADTERPLLWEETVPVLERAGFEVKAWNTYGFFGFCLFMNSDVLYFNRLFRFIPGIRALTRLSTRIDDLTVRLPGLRRAGLQVVGVACKPEGRDT